MNTKLVIWIVGILFVVVVAATAWYFLFVPKNSPQSTQSTVTFPNSSSAVPTSSVSISSQPSGGMTLVVQGGGTVVVNDFIHNGVTLRDKSNPGNYLLAGNLGYCFSNPQQCQAAPTTDFAVYYNSGPQSFTITLTKEPIGQARLDMEQFILTTLGLTQQQTCSLNYLVGVTRYVNSQYTGKNLGFSFCQGATVLPK